MRNILQRITLLAAWVLAIGGIVAMAIQQSGSSAQFFGIADDQEQTIRFSAPVEIVSYGFEAGQTVTPGDLIVEVRQPELDAELKVIDEKLQALASGNLEERASMHAEIVQLDADLRATLSELDMEINTLRANQAAAQAISGYPSAAGGGVTDSGAAGFTQALQGLQQRRQALTRSTRARSDDLRARLANTARPVDAQLAELGERRQELQRQRNAQRVYANFDGQVGSVLFKIGEKVPPYQPILTVHGTRPTFVNGFIHESVVNDVKLHQTVWIRAANGARDEQWYEGEVQSLGSRIVEYPVRLKVNPQAQAWGREVLVGLKGPHNLLLGERVTVQLEQPHGLTSQVKQLVAVYAP